MQQRLVERKKNIRREIERCCKPAVVLIKPSTYDFFSFATSIWLSFVAAEVMHLLQLHYSLQKVNRTALLKRTTDKKLTIINLGFFMRRAGRLQEHLFSLTRKNKSKLYHISVVCISYDYILNNGLDGY